MRRITLPLILLATAVAGALSATPAVAQTRVFVAAQGSDANHCTFAAPCRTFQHAHDVVAAGGEIDALDPAGYGPLVISKALTIQGHGYAGVMSTTGIAIQVAAGADDRVDLVGLLIDGAGAGISGVSIVSGLSVAIQDCSIRRFTGVGVAALAGNLVMTNVTIADVIRPTAPTYGVVVQGIVKAVLDHVTIVASDNGVALLEGIQPAAMDVTVTDSVIANNQSIGVQLLLSTSSGRVRLRRTTMTGNGTGWSGPGIFSYGDNTIENNGSGNTAPPSLTSK